MFKDKTITVTTTDSTEKKKTHKYPVGYFMTTIRLDKAVMDQARSIEGTIAPSVTEASGATLPA
jgi:hypothetical protein